MPVEPEIEILLHVGGVQDRNPAVHERRLALVGDRGGFGAGVVAREHEHAAVRGGARVVAVLQRIARAIDAGPLPVPDAEDAVVAGGPVEMGLLRAPDGGRREVFVHPGLETDVVGFELGLRLPEREVVGAERRAAIARDEARGVQTRGEIAAPLHQGQPNQRLDAREIDAPALAQVAVLEPVVCVEPARSRHASPCFTPGLWRRRAKIITCFSRLPRRGASGPEDDAHADRGHDLRDRPLDEPRRAGSRSRDAGLPRPCTCPSTRTSRSAGERRRRRASASSPRSTSARSIPFVTLAAAAAVTSRLRLGTGIALVAQHDPIVLAKTLATLDHLSAGRLVLGIGYGWNVDEMESHGVDARRRRAITREKMLAMQALWTHDVAEFHGEFVSFEPSWQWPKPVQKPRPRVWIGGAAGPILFAQIAEYADGWMPDRRRGAAGGPPRAAARLRSPRARPGHARRRADGRAAGCGEARASTRRSASPKRCCACPPRRATS